MAHARSQHPNAALTPAGRRRMVACVARRTAGRSRRPRSGSRSTPRRCASGATGSSPKATTGCWTAPAGRTVHRTRPAQRSQRRVVALRRRHRWGADHIAPRARPRRLDGAGDPASRRPRPPRPRRPRHRRRAGRGATSATGPVSWSTSTSRSSPGIPDRRRLADPRPRPSAPTAKRSASATASSTPPSTTAPASPTPRSSTTNKPPPPPRSGSAPHAWFAAHGITIERVLTDNGSCYRSRPVASRAAPTPARPTKRTRPYRPQTNGKVERFHRILLEEWAYIRPWRSERQRTAAYDGFIHFYNHHRSHGALGWATPIATLHRHLEDNLPGFHT